MHLQRFAGLCSGGFGEGFPAEGEVSGVHLCSCQPFPAHTNGGVFGECAAHEANVDYKVVKDECAKSELNAVSFCGVWVNAKVHTWVFLVGRECGHQTQNGNLSSINEVCLPVL